MLFRSPVFKDIVEGLKDRQSKESLALRFHLGIAQMIKGVAIRLREESGISRVVLSGGVFQNRLLLKEAEELLYKEGFAVFKQKEVSCSDSGISLGEAAIANFRS